MNTVIQREIERMNAFAVHQRAEMDAVRDPELEAIIQRYDRAHFDGGLMGGMQVVVRLISPERMMHKAACELAHMRRNRVAMRQMGHSSQAIERNTTEQLVRCLGFICEACTRYENVRASLAAAAAAE